MALLSSALLATSPHYAVAVGGSNVYMLGQGTTWTSYKYAMSGADYTAIAVQDDYIYAVDRTRNRVDVYHVKTLGDASGIEPANYSISLPSTMSSPTSIAIDAYGGVFVSGKMSSNENGSFSTYAYITKAYEKSYQLESVTIPNAATLGVVSAGDSALVLYQDVAPGHIAGCAGVAQGFGANPAVTYPLADINRYPQAITLHTGNDHAYIVSRATNNSTTTGAISVFMPDTGPVPGGNFALPGNMVPDTLAGFTLGANECYLGIIGTLNNSTEQIWKVRLNATSGLPQISSHDTFQFADADRSQDHYAAASADNSLLWVTNTKTSSKAGTVLALDTSSDWTSSPVYDRYVLDDVVLGIADFDPTYVPEPSSLVALATLGTGVLALVRRRRA